MILILIAFLPAVLVSGEEDPVVACSWTPDLGLSPGDIDPFICTHLSVGLSVWNILNNNKSAAQVTQIMRLKRKNNQLQVLLNVRLNLLDQAQIDQLLDILRLYSLDGIRVAEFGNIGQSNTGFKKFEQNLKNLKSKLSRGAFIILLDLYGDTDELYSIPNWDAISENTNLISLVWTFKSFKNVTFIAALNSEDHSNIRFAVDYMVSKGAPKNKLLVGLPTFGYLIRWEKDLYSDSYKMISKHYTYRKICKLIKDNPDWVEEWDQQASTSIIKTKDGTLLYNSQRSFKEKMKFVTNRKLRGVYVYDLSNDDFRGECGEKFPLISEAKKHFSLSPSELDFWIQLRNDVLSP